MIISIIFIYHPHVIDIHHNSKAG